MANFCEALAKTQKVVVFADKMGGAKEAAYDKKCAFPVYRIGGWKPVRRRVKSYKVHDFLKKNNVRGIYTDSWKSAELLINRKRTVPLLCLAHGAELTKLSGPKKKRVLSVFQKVEKIIANSEFTKSLLIKLGVTKNKIVVCYPGVEKLSKPTKKAPKKYLKHSPLLITVGRLEARKGQDLTIEALPKLLEKFPDLGYIVAGGGAYEKHLKNLCQKLGLEKQVHFTGPIGDPEKAVLLKAADLFVMPCRQVDKSVEGFGIAYLEAATLGVPSLAGSVGGAKEAVLHGKTGAVCKADEKGPIEKALATLLKDKKNLQKLGQNAKKRVEKDFLWPRVAKAYLQCLNEVEKERP